MIDLILSLLWLFIIAIIARSILSWFNLPQGNPIQSALYNITEPILGPMRRYLPRLGYLDLSPMIAILVIRFLLIPLVEGLRV